MSAPTYRERCPDCDADDSALIQEESQAFGSERRQCRACGTVWDVVESTFALPVNAGDDGRWGDATPTSTVQIGGLGFPVISAEEWFAANPEAE